MTVQLKSPIHCIIAGTIAAAVLSQAPQVSASMVTASLVTANAASAEAETASPADCESAIQGTILNDATTSIAALGSDAALAQASVLMASLGCLISGGIWLKRQHQ